LLDEKLTHIKNRLKSSHRFQALVDKGKERLQNGLDIIRRGIDPIAARRAFLEAKVEFQKAEELAEGHSTNEVLKQKALLSGCERFVTAWQAELNGKLREAVKQYLSLEANHPGLRVASASRRTAIERRLRSTQTIWPQVKALADANRIDEALLRVATALRAKPNERQLREMDEGLRNLRIAVSTYGHGGLRRILGQAGTAADRAITANPFDRYSRKIKQEVTAWDLQCVKGLTSSKTHFSNKEFASVEADAIRAKALAGQIASKMRAAAKKFDDRADKAKGDKEIGFKGFKVKIKNTGDDAKARRLTRTAETFRSLERQAKNLK
jgi:hypothetical protein